MNWMPWWNRQLCRIGLHCWRVRWETITDADGQPWVALDCRDCGKRRLRWRVRETEARDG